MDNIYCIFSIRLTVAQNPFYKPVSWHFLTHLTYTWWSVNHFTNEGYSGSVTSPLSPQHPGESGKSCCPLVMMELAEEPQEKKKRKSSSIRVLLSLLCLCPSLFPPPVSFTLSLHVPCCSVILRDASEGDHLLIHLSPALLPVPPPLSYRWSGLAFPLAALFVAANRHSGRGGCVVGGGAGGCALYSLRFTQRENRHCQTCILVVRTHHKQLISPDHLLSNLCLSKVSIAGLTWVRRHTNFIFLHRLYSLSPPLGLKDRELIIIWTYTPWNRF